MKTDIFVSVTDLVLEKVDSVKVKAFLRDRERYEA